jgi:ATP/maltotriose-dependent transcriptional regulator MalT
MTLGLVYLHCGEISRARREMLSVQRYASSTGTVYLEFFTLWAQAQMDEMDGRIDAARARYLELLDLWDRSGDRHEVLPGLRAAATFFSRQALVPETNRCAAIAGKLGAQSGNPESIATLAYVLGEAALVSGKEDEAIKNFTRAFETLHQNDLQVEAMIAASRVGEVLIAAGRQDPGHWGRDRLPPVFRKFWINPGEDPQMPAAIRHRRNPFGTACPHDNGKWRECLPKD